MTKILNMIGVVTCKLVLKSLQKPNLEDTKKLHFLKYSPRILKKCVNLRILGGATISKTIFQWLILTELKIADLHDCL